MIDKRRNIFRDGELVETVVMPIEIYKGTVHQKREWAQKVLADYISTFHGKESRWRAIGHINLSTGRVTGTKAQFFNNGKEIIYMISEPEKQPGPDGKYRVHILKAEYQPEKEASPTETMIHQFKAKSFSCTLFEAAKFKH
ncbi:MAG: hypothetical protein A2V69_00125 [Candidatus Portnoybacteria bacterium RBG_13_40_8]|uniref:Uncharacterized protein n=1 Tax=Candidatus Portnoybacteria bacterium RBG_13_40_8 TaxID=1801990 RepID=A0A1G2F371_9BACT|nr:MAG: hypothetical protein A2V69_00125 [Candidatus Portnoybacteria bacterium RBG_13_40_8]OGZ34533.1 MAG: hypothetical protein A2V60_03130 [Candidatus Portnoybacteria bacterium RIFCSPHIGHO2_01_FULL_39_19]